MGYKMTHQKLSRSEHHKHLDGKSVQQIAAELGVSHQAVSQTLRRAIAKLQRNKKILSKMF